jgi:hypothetical protein
MKQPLWKRQNETTRSTPIELMIVVAIITAQFPDGTSIITADSEALTLFKKWCLQAG